MATLCEAARQKKQAAAMLRRGMGGWVLDIGSVLTLLEADGDCCSAECEGNE